MLFRSEESQAAPAGATKITHWEMVNGPAATYGDAAASIVDRFNAENDQNIFVELQMTPWDNFYQTFLTAITSGAAPDTSTGASGQPIQYAVMGEILDLQPIVDQWNAEGSSVPSELPPGGLQTMTYDGILTGIPWAIDPRGFVYRTDYFEQAGIANPPTTWDEFLDCCAKLKAALPDVVPFVFCGGDQIGGQTILNFLVQNDTGLTDENTQADFTNSRVIETLELFGKLYDNGYISEGTASYKGSDAEKMYYSGTAAIWFNGSPAGLKDYPDVEKVSAIMPVMKGPSGSSARNYIWMNSIMAYTQTESPDACRSFIKFWIENELPLWTEGGCSQVPSVSSNSSNEYFQNIWYQKQFAELIIPNSVPTCYPAPAAYPAFSQIEGEDYYGKALQAVITGNRDYAAIAQTAHDQIAKALADYAE